MLITSPLFSSGQAAPSKLFLGFIGEGLILLIRMFLISIVLMYWFDFKFVMSIKINVENKFYKQKLRHFYAFLPEGKTVRKPRRTVSLKTGRSSALTYASDS